MTNKDAVLEIVRNLPDDASLDEIIEEIQILEAINRGLEAVDRGEVVPHDEAKRRIEAWLSGSNGPTPHSPASKMPSHT